MYIYIYNLNQLDISTNFHHLAGGIPMAGTRCGIHFWSWLTVEPPWGNESPQWRWWQGSNAAGLQEPHHNVADYRLQKHQSKESAILAGQGVACFSESFKEKLGWPHKLQPPSSWEHELIVFELVSESKSGALLGFRKITYQRLQIACKCVFSFCNFSLKSLHKCRSLQDCQLLSGCSLWELGATKQRLALASSLHRRPPDPYLLKVQPKQILHTLLNMPSSFVNLLFSPCLSLACPGLSAKRATRLWENQLFKG